jgi:two-component system, LytTR family, sensor kinase
VEGFKRRVETGFPGVWTRIQLVWKWSELGSPSFWPLQIFGWAGFYLLILLTVVFPSRSYRELLNQTVCWTTVFAVSFLLRPVCRSLLANPRPWLALEMRAFGLSVAAGALCTLVVYSWKSRGASVEWADFLQDWLQFSVIQFLWCTLYFGIKQWQQSLRERERRVLAESEAREARLSALRYQLNPHFLFNSLNAVSTLVLQGKATAATRMLAQIGELLRITLDRDERVEIPLSEELAFVEQYLAIEQTRLGDRLHIATAVARDALDAQVPSMLLQPLVENAVRHGVATLSEGGTIRIECQKHGHQLWMTIKNSGPPVLGQSGEIGNSKGIGLANTAARLKALYGKNHRFSFAPEERGGYQVTIEIPWRETVPLSEELYARIDR